MGKTLAEKILSEKSGTNAKAGDMVIAQVDLVCLPDVSAPLTLRQFQASGKECPSLPLIIGLDTAPSPISGPFWNYLIPIWNQNIDRVKNLLKGTTSM